MNPGLHIVHDTASAPEALDKHILRALIYFDIFTYPLTVQEIILFMGVTPKHLSDVEAALQSLCDNLMIYRFGDLYALRNEGAIADRRRAGNAAAAAIMPKAMRRSRLIQRFPFVRSVNISGSLSKQYFDEGSDLDFFIIAAPNRIWVCRLFLTLFKKIFLLNSRKYFCINYYIDTENLLIPDKNLFAATEIITLKNHTGYTYYAAFLAANAWVYAYFPNFAPTAQLLHSSKEPFIKRSIEKILSGRFGNTVDDLAFGATTKFLRKKYHHLSNEEFSNSLRARKHASKHHPQGFQFRVMEAYHKQCKVFEEKHGISLHEWQTY